MIYLQTSNRSIFCLSVLNLRSLLWSTYFNPAFYRQTHMLILLNRRAFSNFESLFAIARQINLKNLLQCQHFNVISIAFVAKYWDLFSLGFVYVSSCCMFCLQIIRVKFFTHKKSVILTNFYSCTILCL